MDPAPEPAAHGDDLPLGVPSDAARAQDADAPQGAPEPEADAAAHHDAIAHQGEGPTTRAGATRPPRRIWPVLAVLTVLLVVVAVVVRMRQPDDVAAAPVVTTTTTQAPTTTTTSTTRPPRPTTTLPPDPVPPVKTVTAILPGKVPGYDAPNGAQTRVVDNLYYGFPTALSVIEQTDDGWLHVRVPYKPNGSTTWIRKEKVLLDSTPWAIQIDVTRKHLKLFNAGQLVVDAPVGVGTAYTPTPLGDFFVTFLQKPENASYGPFVMITTGHSDVLQSFGGFPDGILGIHGPIGADGMIGDTGAAISNGCIRMHVVDQVRLQQVTSGTPVHIYASPVPEPEPPEDAPGQPATDPASPSGATPVATPGTTSSPL